MQGLINLGGVLVDLLNGAAIIYLALKVRRLQKSP